MNQPQPGTTAEENLRAEEFMKYVKAGEAKFRMKMVPVVVPHPADGRPTLDIGIAAVRAIVVPEIVSPKDLQNGNIIPQNRLRG